MYFKHETIARSLFLNIRHCNLLEEFANWDTLCCPKLSNFTVPIQPLQLDDHKNSISHQQWSQVIDVGTCWEFSLSLSMFTRFHQGDWEMKRGARSNLEEAAPVNGPCANMGRPGSAWVVGKWWSTAAGHLDPLSFWVAEGQKQISKYYELSAYYLDAYLYFNCCKWYEPIAFCQSWKFP